MTRLCDLTPAERVRAVLGSSLPEKTTFTMNIFGNEGVICEVENFEGVKRMPLHQFVERRAAR